MTPNNISLPNLGPPVDGRRTTSRCTGRGAAYNHLRSVGLTEPPMVLDYFAFYFPSPTSCDNANEDEHNNCQMLNQQSPDSRFSVSLNPYIHPVLVRQNHLI